LAQVIGALCRDINAKSRYRHHDDETESDCRACQQSL